MLLHIKRIFKSVRRKPTVHLGLWLLGWAKAEAQTTAAERDCLARHANGKKHLAEIGVWHGATTCWLRRAMAQQGSLVAIDPYPVGKLGFSAQRIIAHREVSKISKGSVTWLRTTGSEAARELSSSIFDFVFVDGDHSYKGLQADWEGWSKLISLGGIIALHDSRSSPSRQIPDDVGSVHFTHDVVERDPRFQVIEVIDSLTVLQRSQFQPN